MHIPLKLLKTILAVGHEPIWKNKMSVCLFKVYILCGCQSSGAWSVDSFSITVAFSLVGPVALLTCRHFPCATLLDCLFGPEAVHDGRDKGVEDGLQETFVHPQQHWDDNAWNAHHGRGLQVGEQTWQFRLLSDGVIRVRCPRSVHRTSVIWVLWILCFTTRGSGETSAAPRLCAGAGPHVVRGSPARLGASL